MSFKTKRVLAATASAAVATLFLAGCAPAGNDVAAGCEAYADYQGFDGTEVEVYTTIIAPEADLFVESFAEFEECTGITVNWNGTQEFEAQIAVRVEGGTAPDLAIFPQPGLLARFKDSLVAAPAKVSESVDANYSPDWKNYGTVDGTFFAAPLGANVKSFVWYNPKVFADNNYTIPTTWQELLDL
jgi:alpha-glucoside transport system substrate-binding protein